MNQHVLDIWSTKYWWTDRVGVSLVRSFEYIWQSLSRFRTYDEIRACMEESDKDVRLT